MSSIVKINVKPNSGQGNAKGDAAMEYTAEAPFTANISQKVENLTDGKYTLEVSTQGVGSASSYNLYVIGDNGIKKTAPIEEIVAGVFGIRRALVMWR